MNTTETQGNIKDYWSQHVPTKQTNYKKWTNSGKGTVSQDWARKKQKISTDQSTTTETETVVLNHPTNKSPRLRVFTGKFYQTLREELTRILVKLFQKFAEEETLWNTFHEAIITLIPKPDKFFTTEDYRPVSLMKIDIKIINKILVNQIQQYIKMITHHDQVGFFPGM